MSDRTGPPRTEGAGITGIGYRPMANVVLTMISAYLQVIDY
jgi:hypothetical protein